MKRFRSGEVLAANLAWLSACLPGALAFLFAAVFPRIAQQRLLRRMLARAADTKWGRGLGPGLLVNDVNAYRAVPLGDYETFRPFVNSILSGEANVLTSEPVRVLQPTSGTSASPKLIPFTAGLRRQFQAALSPWIASLYVLRPRLLLGRQYWCLSPNTRPVQSGASAVRIGFADDTEYLGPWQRWFAARLLVAPPELARVEDPASFEFLTLLFLVRENNLRLISVWHPSFLTLLLDALFRRARRLADGVRTGTLPADLALSPELRAAFASRLTPDPERAGEIARVASAGDLARLWPHLEIISCWAGRDAETSLTRLRTVFPRVTIQSKGLLATEGVVSFPWGFSGRHLPAVRSHFLEFIESQSGQLKRVWELREGKTYSVVLTTAGGLYRYQLHDRVRVRGFWARTPQLEFLGREGVVSDLCGEKLTGEDIEAALADFAQATGLSFDFAMAAPDRIGSVPGYVLIVEGSQVMAEPDNKTHERIFDGLLQRNFHYAHARRLGQLRPLRMLPVRNAAAFYRTALVRRGQRPGEVKFPPLCEESVWRDVFREAEATMASTHPRGGT
jgi:hypothetical protein